MKRAALAILYILTAFSPALAQDAPTASDELDALQEAWRKVDTVMLTAVVDGTDSEADNQRIHVWIDRTNRTCIFGTENRDGEGEVEWQGMIDGLESMIFKPAIKVRLLEPSRGLFVRLNKLWNEEEGDAPAGMTLDDALKGATFRVNFILIPRDGDEDGTMTVSAGFSSGDETASWYRDLRRADSVEVDPGESSVIFTADDETKYTIGRANGILEAIEMNNEDGSSLKVTVEKAELGAARPDFKLPETVAESPMDYTMHTIFRIVSQAYFDRMSNVSDFSVEGNREKFVEWMSQWACARISAAYAEDIRSSTHRLIKSELEAGTPLAQMTAAEPAVTQSVRQFVSQIQQTHVTSVISLVRSELMDQFAPSRRDAEWLALLDDALDGERINKYMQILGAPDVTAIVKDVLANAKNWSVKQGK